MLESSTLTLLALYCYAAGAMLAWLGVRRREAAWATAQLAVLVMGLLAQTAAISTYCAASSSHFFTGWQEILWLLSWSLAANYLGILWFAPIHSLGLLLLPANVLLLAIAHYGALPPGPPVETLAGQPLYVLHVMSAFLGYGLFLTACAASLAYLQAHLSLRRKAYQWLWGGLPSLRQAERIATLGAWVGVAIFSVALVAGVLMAVWSRQENWFLEPKIWSAQLTWLLFLGLAVGRSLGRVSGRTAARAILAGAGLVVVTFFLGHPFLGVAQ